MLSTLTIISIFTEIFTAGILISGTISFIKSYLLSRQLKDLFFSLVFLSLFGYTTANLGSQLMFNSGWSLGDLIMVQKLVSGSIVLCGTFLWLFLAQKFEFKKLNYFSVLVFLFAAYLIYGIIDSSVNLVYREEVVEPIVNFYPWIPVKPFLAFMLSTMILFSFGAGFRSSKGKRSLFFFSGISALLLLGSLFSSYLYVRFGEGSYQLVSWILTLFSILGLLLGELIPPDSPEARAPLKFLRTRILLKLM